MSLLRKAALVNGSELVCFGLGVFQAVVCSRVLGPIGIGQYAIILSTLVLVAQFFSLGFPLSFLYYSQHDTANSKIYLINTIWSMLFLGAVGGVVAGVIIYCNSSYFGKIPWFALLATSAYVPIVLQAVVTRNYLLIAIEAKRLSLISLFAMFGAVLLILVLALLGFLSVSQALLCFILAATIRAGLGWFWMKRNVDFSIKPTWQINRKLGLMGVRQSWVDIMILANTQINILMIKYLQGNFESVGYFSRGQQVAMLAVTSGQAILPLLFSRWASFPEDKLAPHVEKVMRFASSIGVIMITVILLGGKWIVILLYGKMFLPSVQPMMILVPGTVLYLLSYTLVQLLGSRGVPEMAALMLFCGAVVNTILCWLLIPVMGISGAALAAAIGHVILLISLTIIVKTKYNIRVANCIMLRNSDIQSMINTLKTKKTTNIQNSD